MKIPDTREQYESGARDTKRENPVKGGIVTWRQQRGDHAVPPIILDWIIMSGDAQ
jgi:hypothetical protein